MAHIFEYVPIFRRPIVSMAHECYFQTIRTRGADDSLCFITGCPGGRMMYDEIRTLIQKSTLNLLKTEEYKEIQMKEIAANANIGRRTLYRYYACKDDIMEGIVNALMDDFAKTINENYQMTLEGVAYAFFLFWENNIEEMKLLKKAHLMYLIEDNLPELVTQVSLKTKYKDLSEDAVNDILAKWSDEDIYNYNYMLAGYFKVAQLWMNEEHRRTPEEMAKIMKRIVLREPSES